MKLLSRRGAEAQRMKKNVIGTPVIEADITRCINGFEE